MQRRSFRMGLPPCWVFFHVPQSIVTGLYRVSSGPSASDAVVSDNDRFSALAGTAGGSGGCDSGHEGFGGG